LTTAGAATDPSSGAGTSGSAGVASPNPADSSGGQQLPDESQQQSPDIDSEETSFFFSYDESASTASRDLALTALANGRKPDPELGRPYEFLNAEKIGASIGEPVGPFNVTMGLLQSMNGEIPQTSSSELSVYGLGVNISGPTQTMEERRNVVLTVLLDISGSMNSSYADETANDVRSLLDVAKLGLIFLLMLMYCWKHTAQLRIA